MAKNNKDCENSTQNNRKNGGSQNRAKNKGKRFNQSSKGRNNEYNTKRPNSTVDKGSELASRGRDNDPNWYFYNSELANEVMNYSFETVLGMDDVTGNVRIPTIATIFCNPSCGTSVISEDQSSYTLSDNMPTAADYSVGFDGANYMATKLYSLLSATSGRNANYQANDVLMAILSTSSIAEMIESLRRVFGVTYLYSMYNRAIPRALVEAMNIDFDDLVAGYADYKAELNYQISRINQIPMLANITYMDKSIRMYQHIYADDESPLSQLFMYCPATVWRLDEQSFSTGSALVTEYWMCDRVVGTNPNVVTIQKTPGSYNLMSGLISILTSCIDAVLNSTTLNLVYMDLLHMAEKSSEIKFLQFDFVSSDYAVLPIYDENALLQFHNLNFMSNYFYTDPNNTTGIFTPLAGSCDITLENNVMSDANTGRIFYNPGFLAVNWPASDMLVDFPDGIPDLEDKIEAQRLTCVPSNWHCTISGIGMPVWPVNVLPDHYPILMYIHESRMADPSWNDQTVLGEIQISTLRYLSALTSGNNLATTRSICNSIASKAAALSKFKHAPNVWVSLGGQFYETFGDFTYYTLLPWYKCVRMSQYIYSGLFTLR